MSVAIYGATGRTGRAVVAQLARSGRELLLCGRDAAALQRLRSGVPVPSRCRIAPGAAGELRTALADASAVVQCAALSLEDALSVVAAALDRRAAYIDVCADGGVGEAIGDAYSDAARRAGVPLFLGVAPIGGALGEWLGVEAARAVCATDDPSEIDEIVLAYASDGLPRSTGSLRSGLKMLLEPTLGTGSHARLDFPPPFGRAFAFRFPLGSGCLCQLFPRAAVDVYASLCLDGVDSALSTALILGAMAWTTRLRNPGPVFEALASRLSSFEGAPEDSTVDGLTFAVVAQAASGRRHTSVAAVGSAPYRLTAAMIELVLQQLASGRAAGGVVGVSELVPASAALDALARTCDLRLFESGDEPVRGRRE